MMTQSEEKLVGDVDKARIGKAVDALLKLDGSKHSKDLFSDSVCKKINLQFSFARAGVIKHQIIKIPLPHSIHQDSSEVCLFVKDIERKKRDYEPTVDHFGGLLKDKDITCISEVIPLMALKTEYTPFEAKKTLANRFDMFLADDSIVRLLPSYLGKNFYSRKKNPVQVNLKAKDLRREIMKAISNTCCHLSGRGACGMVTCAHTGMPIDQIADNIVATISKLCTSVPGRADNLKTFNIKTVDSESIPLIVTLKSSKKISPFRKDSSKDSSLLPEAEDVTTVEGGKVIVTKAGVLILERDDGSQANLTRFEEEQNAEVQPIGKKIRVMRKRQVSSGPPAKRGAKKLSNPAKRKKKV